MYHFIISDKDNIKRRNHIKNEFQKIGVEPNFFNAIIGKKLDDKALNYLTSKDRYLSDGEIGCALSHKAVLEKFLESSHESIIIFEDDISFSNGVTRDFFTDVKKVIGDMESPSVLALYTTEIIYKEVLKINNITIYRTPRFMRSHAYVINRKAAKIILELQTPVYFEYDQFRFYYYLKGCKLYSLEKNYVCAEERSFKSSIGLRSDKNINYKRKINLKSLVNKLSLYEQYLYYIRRIKKHIKSRSYNNYKDCIK